MICRYINNKYLGISCQNRRMSVILCVLIALSMVDAIIWHNRKFSPRTKVCYYSNTAVAILTCLNKLPIVYTIAGVRRGECSTLFSFFKCGMH